MRNEIKIRKRRFAAAVLAFLLLLSQIPPISVGAAETYEVTALSENQILNPGDTISNSADLACGITYYDCDDAMTQLSSGSITQSDAHTVPEYEGTLSDGFEFTGWQVYSVNTISGGGVESVTMRAMVSINGTELSESLQNTTLYAGTVIYSATDSYTITYYDQDGTTPLITAATITANTPYTVSGYPGTVPTGQRFVGWTVSYIWASGGSGSIDLTAQLATNQYTITFDTNGGTAVSAITADYGADVTAPADPTRTGYTFAGWDQEIPTTMPAENITITAQWTPNKYTIKFQNEDGSVLQSGEVAYDATPVYNGETPTKASTAELSYTFAGWTPEVTAVTGESTYTATFTESARKYTIKFVNEDGTPLYSGEVAYEELPNYGGEMPVKAADAQYTYSFAGWSPEIVPVTGDATYTATYTGTVNQYIIAFVDGDGVELQSDELAYGEMPVYQGGTPAKSATAEYSYTFTGWTPEIAAVTGSTTYTATFAASTRRYTVKFVNEDGTELQSSEVTYGETPVYSGETPTKEADDQYSYTFAGWDAELAPVTGTVTYTATYAETVNQYTVKFVNEDGTQLQSSEVAYGETPAYTGETPTKAADGQYSYTFAGWDAELVPVSGDATYTATYTQTVNRYTVKFVNEDGTQLQSSEIAYGETPVYNGATPTKAADAQYSYTFAGWDAELAPVSGTATYTATYTETVNQYTVKFVNEDGTPLYTGEVAYGELPNYDGAMPVKAATAQYTYLFNGWSPETVPVTGDATYTATYTGIVNEYIIAFVDGDGVELQSSEVAYGEMPVYYGGTPAKTATAEHSYTFAGWTPEIAAVTGSATYTATFTEAATQYTITFDTAGGSEIAAITAGYGAAFTVPEDPTKTGYTFAGWDREIPAAMPAENLTITAQWTANRYSIQYVLNGGTNGENPDSYAYGTGVSGFADAVKPGYTFAGWYESADFSGEEVTSVTADRTDDITLYAKFEMGTIEAGTYSLTAGVEYRLGNVTTVSGDSSMYIPGSVFYVSAGGSYTFS